MLALFLGKELGVKILTQDKLEMRSWRMLNRCHMCTAEEEMDDHILLHCLKAHMLWFLIFSFFDVQWRMHSSEVGEFLSWDGSLVGKKGKRSFESCLLSSFGAFEGREI